MQEISAEASRAASSASDRPLLTCTISEMRSSAISFCIPAASFKSPGIAAPSKSDPSATLSTPIRSAM